MIKPTCKSPKCYLATSLIVEDTERNEPHTVMMSHIYILLALCGASMLYTVRGDKYLECGVSKKNYYIAKDEMAQLGHVEKGMTECAEECRPDHQCAAIMIYTVPADDKEYCMKFKQANKVHPLSASKGKYTSASVIVKCSDAHEGPEIVEPIKRGDEEGSDGDDSIHRLECDNEYDNEYYFTASGRGQKRLGRIEKSTRVVCKTSCSDDEKCAAYMVYTVPHDESKTEYCAKYRKVQKAYLLRKSNTQYESVIIGTKCQEGKSQPKIIQLSKRSDEEGSDEDSVPRLDCGVPKKNYYIAKDEMAQLGHVEKGMTECAEECLPDHQCAAIMIYTVPADDKEYCMKFKQANKVHPLSASKGKYTSASVIVKCSDAHEGPEIVEPIKRGDEEESDGDDSIHRLECDKEYDNEYYFTARGRGQKSLGRIEKSTRVVCKTSCSDDEKCAAYMVYTVPHDESKTEYCAKYRKVQKAYLLRKSNTQYESVIIGTKCQEGKSQPKIIQLSKRSDEEGSDEDSVPRLDCGVPKKNYYIAKDEMAQLGHVEKGMTECAEECLPDHQCAAIMIYTVPADDKEYCMKFKQANKVYPLSASKGKYTSASVIVKCSDAHEGPEIVEPIKRGDEEESDGDDSIHRLECDKEYDNEYYFTARGRGQKSLGRIEKSTRVVCKTSCSDDEKCAAYMVYTVPHDESKTEYCAKYRKVQKAYLLRKSNTQYESVIIGTKCQEGKSQPKIIQLSKRSDEEGSDEDSVPRLDCGVPKKNYYIAKDEMAQLGHVEKGMTECAEECLPDHQCAAIMIYTVPADDKEYCMKFKQANKVYPLSASKGKYTSASVIVKCGDAQEGPEIVE
ncbi:uncharacterized protein LOC141904952 [Tubulanus polymorphus]|uniref:uncharacterized protein LOC141904952 n=1 Tax=Tubulanus polymorphus TaxID=672921 RepID=UPI003DA378D2